MTSNESVMRTFKRIYKAAQAFVLTQCTELIASTSEHFVHVALMPDIPQNLIFRRVENFVQCEGYLDDSKIGSQMPTGFRKVCNNLLPNFVVSLFSSLGLLIASKNDVVGLAKVYIRLRIPSLCFSSRASWSSRAFCLTQLSQDRAQAVSAHGRNA
jgi:hypothetical protein